MYFAKECTGSDLDPQAHASFGLNVTVGSDEPTIYDAILAECGNYESADIEQVIYETPYPNIHLLPAELDLSIAELVLYEAKDKLTVLQRLLYKIEDQYDFILIDLPPHLGMLMMNGIIASDYVMIPVEPSWYGIESLKNFEQFQQELERDTGFKLNHLSFILTRYKKAGFFNLFENKQMKEIIDFLQSKSAEQVFIVPESKSILMAQKQRKLLADCYPGSATAKVYQQLSENLIKQNYESAK